MPEQNEKMFEHTMKYACILNAYIKRLSNMLLLYHQNCRIFSGELCLAISESLEYVRLYGIKAHFEYRGESLMAGERVLIAAMHECLTNTVKHAKRKLSVSEYSVKQ